MMIRNLFLVGSLLLTACMPEGGLPGLPNGNTSGNTSGSASANVSGSVGASLPSPAEIASFTGLKASACSEEGSIKSATGAATTVKFTNNAEGRIKLYWLNTQGERVEYKRGGLAKGETHTQGTFVTHPWLITNEQDQCMGIYTPESPGTVTLDINKTVTLSGGSSASGNVAGSTTASEERVRQGIACLEAKGSSGPAAAAKASLNLYLQAKSSGVMGADLFGQAHLTSAVSVINENGC